MGQWNNHNGNKEIFLTKDNLLCSNSTPNTDQRQKRENINFQYQEWRRGPHYRYYTQ